MFDENNHYSLKNVAISYLYYGKYEPTSHRLIKRLPKINNPD